MSYRRVGESDLEVSAVGVGCNAFGRRVDERGIREVLAAARDAGITLLDTADIYGDTPGRGEELLGTALDGQRDAFVLATKFGGDMRGVNGPDHGARASRSYVLRSVEASLRRLQSDHIDLLQLHFPDPSTPIEETLSALTDLVRDGKVRHLGCSNLNASQVVDAVRTARDAALEGFVSVQNRYSLLDRAVEAELVPACHSHGLGLLSYHPLERGLLTGKYRRDSNPPAGSRAALEGAHAGWLDAADWDRIEALEGYGAARGLELIDVAIAGLAAQPTVSSVIAGAVSGEQVRRNAAALRWQPTAADLTELRSITPV